MHAKTGLDATPDEERGREPGAELPQQIGAAKERRQLCRQRNRPAIQLIYLPKSACHLRGAGY